MPLYLTDGSDQNVVRAATLRQVADHTFYLTHSQYNDTGSTSPSADPITPSIGLPLSKSLVLFDLE